MAAGAEPIRREPGTAAAAGIAAPDPQRLTPLRELQLVEQYRAGGVRAQEALTELIRAYQRRIFSICLRMVRHPEDSADLTQDVLIKMIEGLPGYTGQSKLSTWVIRIAINCCLSHIRKQKLRTHESLEEGSTSPGGSDEKGPKVSYHARSSVLEGPGRLLDRRELSPQKRIQQEQTRAAILNAMDSLDTEMRAILVLRDLQDLDYQQLAEVLDIPLGTVKSRLFRARLALRQALEARGGI